MNEIEIKTKELPKTYEEAIEYISMSYSKETMNADFFHFTVGMDIRNNLKLWDKNSELYKHMLERFGLCHADDTYALICEAVRAEMDGVKYDPWLSVKRFEEHWARYNVDPKTMKKLSE